MSEQDKTQDLQEQELFMEENFSDDLEDSENYVLDQGPSNVNPTPEELDNADSETPEEQAQQAEQEKAEQELKITATNEKPGAFDPFRMYDTKERQVSMEALELVYAARNPDHRGVLQFPAVEMDEVDGEPCLIVYIPDIQTGVKGILPKSKAGLDRNERLEDLMRYPTGIRVTPDWINRDEGTCGLNRQLAEQIEASRTWKQVQEGQDYDAVVKAVRRDPVNRRPYSVILDVNAIQAQLPIKEVSHNYVEDVDFTRGDILKIRVIQKVEKTTEVDGKPTVRRSLVVSKRALEFNPWANESYIPRIGNPYPGVIVHNSERWVHVRLHTGIVVLAPRPSLNYAGRHKLNEGENVTVYITRIDRENRIARGNLSPAEAKMEIKRNRKFEQRQQLG